MEDIRLKFLALFWRTLAFIYILARWTADGGFASVGVLLSLSSQLLCVSVFSGQELLTKLKLVYVKILLKPN